MKGFEWCGFFRTLVGRRDVEDCSDFSHEGDKTSLSARKGVFPYFTDLLMANFFGIKVGMVPFFNWIGRKPEVGSGGVGFLHAASFEAGSVLELGF